MAWWDDHPERLAREREALRAAGYEYDPEEYARADGCLEMTVYVRLESDQLELRIVFPEHYPYFPPGVFAPVGTFARHQNPTNGALCLLEDAGDGAWNPESDTVAGLLRDQLPGLQAANKSNDTASAAAIEQHAPEPITAFLEHEPRSHVTMPAGDVPAGSPGGRLKVALENIEPFRGAVLEVQDAAGTPVLQADEGVNRLYRQRPHQIITGRWARLPVRPTSNDAKTIKELGREIMPEFAQQRWVSGDRGRPKPQKVDVRAVCFPDELAWRTEGLNWILTVDHRNPSKGNHHKSTKAPKLELDGRHCAQQRIPELQGLAAKTVTLVGAGSVGSVIAESLCQALVGKLCIVDQDDLEAGNAVRWTTGRRLAGLPKAEALGLYLADNYPYTELHAEPWLFGAALPAAPANGRSESSVLRNCLDNIDLIIDASASTLLNNFLADEAGRRGISYIWAHASPGGWGGLVGRIRPHDTPGCWVCHRYWLDEHHGLPAVPSDPNAGTVEPIGCAQPTFAAASVDLNEVSLMAARLAISTLRSSEPSAPSEYPWDIAILSLRDAFGAPIPPSWSTHILSAHPSCCGDD